jgi:pilus assembly protein CpaF
MFRGFGRAQQKEPSATNGSTPAPETETDNVEAPPRTNLGFQASDEASIRYTDLKVRVHQQLLEMMNLSVLDKMQPEEVRREVGDMIRELLGRETVPLTLQQQNQIVSDVLDEVLGLGPIEPLIKDKSISDILVNTYNSVYIERQGKLELTPVKFKDDKHLLRIIDRIVSSVGRRVDESAPMVDARLKDGSRVNAIVPPLAVDGPIVSIRKFATIRPSIESLIELKSITPEMAELLKGVVQGTLNVLISGGTGSGKTTMLNAISRYISDADRIVTIEDAAELQLQQTHVVRLETRPPNIEGKGEITQRDLVRNSLRMRPDRIILGECRGAEAFDMLQAMNTGHDGSLTTIHANTCRDAIGRLEQMIAMAGFDIPVRSLRGQIASALDVIIQLERMSDGRRRMVSLYELTGMEGDVVTMQEIFNFQRTSTDNHGNIIGEFRATGIRPKFMEELAVKGIDMSPEIFTPNRAMG